MKKAVRTGLPGVGRPLEWAVVADGVLYTTLLPIKPDGSFETGDIARQTELTLSHLRDTLHAAGGTMDDVTQVIVHLPDPADFAAMNAVYARFFSEPYPNRATLVSTLVVPGVRIEIIAYAHVGGGKAPRRPARRKAATRTGSAGAKNKPTRTHRRR